MRFIHAVYNMYHNSIDINTYAGYILRIDCNKAEEGLRTTGCSQCALNALAIDEPLDICKPSEIRWLWLALEGNLQIWVDAEDSLELF